MLVLGISNKKKKLKCILLYWVRLHLDVKKIKFKLRLIRLRKLFSLNYWCKPN